MPTFDDLKNYRVEFKKIIVAGLKVALYCEGARLNRQIKQYLVPDDAFTVKEADIRIGCTDERIESYMQKYPLMEPGDCEYMLTGGDFYRGLIMNDGMMLHSSGVVVDGVAYLFSADSGTGKSTHTGLWLQHFGEEAYIINDDKPALRRENGKWFVYGTPWSGKCDISRNTKVPLGAIVFLERSEDNWIEAMPTKEALVAFMKQTVRKITAERMDSLIPLMNKLLKEVDIYKMGCNISDDAVVTAYEAIRVDK
jgi:hypothetical protein